MGTLVDLLDLHRRMVIVVDGEATWVVEVGGILVDRDQEEVVGRP